MKPPVSAPPNPLGMRHLQRAGCYRCNFYKVRKIPKKNPEKSDIGL